MVESVNGRSKRVFMADYWTLLKSPVGNPFYLPVNISCIRCIVKFSVRSFLPDYRPVKSDI